MQVLQGIDARPAPPRPTVVTVGKFVVVHHGHRALLERVRTEAFRLDAASAVVTFDRHPLETIAPDRAPSCRLATLEQRLEMFADAGIEIVLVLPFTPEVAALEPEEFAERTLVHALDVRTVIAGEDFRFGHKHRGDAALLRELGATLGFAVETLPLVDVGGAVVSSTGIRELVLDGRVDEAATFMGRPYRLAGEVVSGARRGRDLGFPTANLRPAERACLPRFGVYAGWWVQPGRRLPGAINVGMTPTFDDVSEPKIEIHVLGLDEDLYGQRGEIEFTTWIRSEERFSSVDELVAQIRTDVETTAKLLGV